MTSLLLDRVKDKLINGALAVTGEQWPIFIYHGYSYDREDPWNGLFRSSLLVMVSDRPFFDLGCLHFPFP
jgi:hypothetical protein